MFQKNRNIQLNFYERKVEFEDFEVPLTKALVVPHRTTELTKCNNPN